MVTVAGATDRLAGDDAGESAVDVAGETVVVEELEGATVVESALVVTVAGASCTGASCTGAEPI